MKKITIRVISILCVCAFLLSLIPISTFAVSSEDKYLPRYNGSSGSISTALKSVGVNNSYSYRARIAAKNNITAYKGSASQNTLMLKYLKAGTLLNPDYKEPTSAPSTNRNDSSIYYPRYTGKSSSLVDALNSLGINSSYDFRCKIAERNGIENYRGESRQNAKILSLLKDAKLINPVAKTTHPHSMKKVEGTGSNVSIKYCRCGYFESNRQGVISTSSSALALPNNGYVLSPEEIAVALAALKAALGSVSSTVGAALLNPYVAIPLVVSGIAVWAYLNCNTETAELIDVKKMTSDYRPSELKNGRFYYSGIFHGDGFSTVLILYNEGMSKEEAKKYMKAVALAKHPLEEMANMHKVTLGSVYTPHPQDAKNFCDDLVKTKYFRYGGDACPDEDIGYNKRLVDNIMYYVHFHLYFDPYKTGMSHMYTKVAGSHVFFGPPYARKTNNSVA